MDREVETTEVRETTAHDGDTNVTRQTVDSRASLPGPILAKRVVYYITGFIIILLLLRIILLLLAANQSNGFVNFIYTISGFFAAPFYGIFSYTPTYGASVFEVSSVVAILVYGLIGWGIAKLVTLGSTRRHA
jgi:hypothetical protein